MSRRLILLCLVIFAVTVTVNAAPKAVPGQALVRFASPITIEQAQAEFNPGEFRVEKVLVRQLNIFLVKFDPMLDVLQAVDMLKGHPKLLWAQADHILSQRVTPNDPLYSSQWAWFQATDRDIDAPEAWDIATGGTNIGGDDIVVAVVDGGCLLTHPDLAANIWQNSAEVNGVNGVDDDNNGYVDDRNGWDGYANDGTIPTDNHGTHVSGTIGAVTNNGSMVAGVNWNVKIMEVAASSSQTSVISVGYGYVLDQKTLWWTSGGTQGANVVSTNSSFGVDLAICTSGSYPVWNDLYNAMGEVGILSACATANANYNVDTQGDVPTSCSSPYIIAVTNTTSSDTKNSGAAYGATTIDLGAPGTSITSTTSNGSTGSLTGTSMATPHVAGAVALMHSAASLGFYNYYNLYPDSGALALKQMLLDGTDPIAALAGITVSGGRLNLYNACLAISEFVGPNPEEPYITVSQAVSNDTLTGDADGAWERTEQVEIVVTLNNLGEDALNVQATLTTLDPYVTIGDGIGTFGDIPNLAEGDNNADVFTATLAPDAPLDYSIDFVLTVTADSGYSRELTLSLDANPKVTYFEENFENGSGDWTHEIISGVVDQWHLSTEQNHTPNSAWKCGDTGTGNYANAQDAGLVSPSVVIADDSELRFWYSLDSELSVAYTDSAYDGGNVWISVNGGPYSLISPVSDYPKDFRYLAGGGNPASGPQPGNPCFAGPTTWRETVFDLSTYADSTVQFRFRFSTDAAGAREGWYIDDVRLLGAPGASAAPQPVDGLVILSEGYDTFLHWPPSSTNGAVYNIYMSTEQNIEPVNGTLVAQTADTFYVHSGIVDTSDYVIYQVTVSLP